VQNVIPSSYEWVITLSRALVNNQTNQREGVFFVDLNFEAISDLCDNYQLGSRGYIFILDNQGNIIYHPRQQLIHGGLLTENIDEIKSSTAPYIITERGREGIIYTRSISEKTGWNVIGVTYTSDLLANTYQTWLIYGLTTLFLLIAVIIISGIISKEITKPIRKLKNAMELVEQGEFLEASIEEITNNELGSLTQSFNEMTERIANLIDENAIEQRERRRSEMRALQAQINPHFLYNTLDSIIWMSEANCNDQVVEMTSALAKLFRQAISNDKEEILIREEKEYVKNYLTIQQMRYKDKLDYSIEIDQEIEGFKIIKFVLQPLVENAIYHGLKYKEGKGYLVIKGYRRGDFAYVEVRDNGIGMTEEKLSEIFKEKETDFKKNGVGINNVQKRLQLFYGETFSLKFQSEINQGTTVTVTIPIEERGGYV
jgi:two-component system sensor histidine kinase YesM